MHVNTTTPYAVTPSSSPRPPRLEPRTHRLHPFPPPNVPPNPSIHLVNNDNLQPKMPAGQPMLTNHPDLLRRKTSRRLPFPALESAPSPHLNKHVQNQRPHKSTNILNTYPPLPSLPPPGSQHNLEACAVSLAQETWRCTPRKIEGGGDKSNTKSNTNLTICQQQTNHRVIRPTVVSSSQTRSPAFPQGLAWHNKYVLRMCILHPDQKPKQAAPNAASREYLTLAANPPLRTRFPSPPPPPVSAT